MTNHDDKPFGHVGDELFLQAESPTLDEALKAVIRCRLHVQVTASGGNPVPLSPVVADLAQCFGAERIGRLVDEMGRDGEVTLHGGSGGIAAETYIASCEIEQLDEPVESDA